MKKTPSAFHAPALQLADVLDARTATASRILVRASKLSELSEALQGIDASWSHQLRVGNVRGDTAVIFAENAGAAARARFEADRIAACLARRGISCRTLVVKIRPSRHSP